MTSFRTARLLSALVLLTTCSPGLAEDPVVFPDPALKAAVMEALGLATDPTPSDMLNLTAMMNATGRGITDLTGLEYAKNLAQVDLSQNQLDDISVLADLPRLREVSLYMNQVTSVDSLAGLAELTYLDLTANQITDISPLADLGKLRVFYFGGNQISDLNPLAGLTTLESLSMPENGISDISPLAALTQLGNLNANGNSIQDLSTLTALENLTILWLGWNQIADITPLSGLVNLTSLQLRDNNITDISALSGLTALTSLNLDTNEVSNLSALSGLTALRELSLAYNQVVDVSPLADLTNLTQLQLSCNQISDIAALAGLINLEGLELQNNKRITDISVLSGLTRLTFLRLNWNLISDISPLATLTDLTVLDLSRNQITDITPLAGLTELTVLYLQDNYLTDISPLASLTRLTELSFDNLAYRLSPEMGMNAVVDISALANLTNLTMLRLEHNQVADISALTGLTTLRELYLTGNPLHPKACVVDIPLIEANNPGIVIHYDGCIEVPQTLTVASTSGGAVVMPGEGAFTYPWGELVPVEAVAEEGYQFTHWSGTAVDPNVMLDPSAIHTSVLMDSDYALTAHFEPQDEPWSTTYFNTFEDQVGSEWSQSITDVTPVGERRFLGQFGNDTITLAMSDLPPHSQVRLSFDLLVIRTWDGDCLPSPPGIPRGQGPDLWSLEVQDGPALLLTTFDNHTTQPYLGFHRQSYPHEYPYGESLPQTGAAERGSLGYVWPHPEGPAPADSVYHLSFAVEHSAPSIRFDFAASGLQPITDESWGLDNVRVQVLTVAPPEVTLTVSSTEGGSVTAPGEGMFTYPQCAEVEVVAEAEDGYYFVSWTGSAVDNGLVADPGALSTTVTVCENASLVAEFASACIVVFDFPLDSDPGWARSGQWDFGVPTGQRCGAWGNNDPISGHTGSNVFGVNLDGCYDPSMGPLYSLVAGPFDLSAYTDVELTFWRWLNADWQEYVRSSVEVSTDGVTWSALWEHSAQGGITDLDWTLCTYRVPQADCRPTVYVRWSYQVIKTLAYSYTGWNIDDIQLTGCLGCDQ